jgi:4-amino-4-deoxy-L-arabinose transferase-like glycosyltransferase
MAVTIGNERLQSASERGLAKVIEVAASSHARAAIVLIVAALLNILPGFFATPPIDRDEARFAQATKQMVESGDYIDIRFQDDVRYKKPVGIYWLQAGAVMAGDALGMRRAHTTIWLYRIPSLIGAIGAVLVTYWAALAFVTRRAAVLAGLMMATCLLLSVEGKLAKTDAMLLLTSVAAMGALARAYLPEQRARLAATANWLVPAIFWTALAGGVLLKGPVIVMFVGLAVGALVVVDRSAGWLLALRPLVGIAWFVALVLPWFLAIVMRAGDSFFVESIVQDLLGKVARGQESHGAPPGFYLLLFWVTFFPGATLAGLAAPAIWASWLVFEMVVTTLPHYVLSLYPAVAILIAGIIDGRMLSRRPWLALGTMWWFVLPVLLGIAGIVALLVIGHRFALQVWPVIGASAVMGLLAWRLYDVDRAEHALLRAAGAAILSLIALCGLIIPSMSQLFPSTTLARVIRDSGCSEPLAASAGHHEPSLVFLVGTSIRLTDAAGAAEFLRGGTCRFAFIEGRQERNFAQRAEVIGLRYSQQLRFEAINTGSGRPTTIAVYRSAGPP